MDKFRLIIVGNMKAEEHAKALIYNSSTLKRVLDYDPDCVEVLSSYRKRSSPGVAEQVARQLECKCKFYKPDTKRFEKGEAFRQMQHKMCNDAAQMPYGGAVIIVWNGVDAKVLSFLEVARQYKLDIELLKLGEAHV